MGEDAKAEDRTITPNDRAVLRDLAKQVAEIAGKPIMEERRRLWMLHNALNRARAMVLVFPEGSWRELLPASSFRCEGERTRSFEGRLLRAVYTHRHFHDDTVIEREWTVSKVVRSSGWGLSARWHWSEDPTGARTFDPVILEPADLKKLRFPEISVDEQATQRDLAEAGELFGDILDVRLRGVAHVSFHLMSIYTSLRGLEQVMIDMIENPSMLHEAMAFLQEGHRRVIKQYVDLNLLSLNNDGTYHSSGGVGYTDELPAAGFDPSRVRPCDMWASAESQEMAQVSPEMHEEFALRYERPLLAPFGLNGYGCCEDLSRKLDYVLTVPRIRRISISPFADVERSAAKLRDKYIFSWKPHPAHVAGDFNPDRIRAYIRHALEATRGCVIEMILKDTHTCENHPERFTVWTRIAREEVERLPWRAAGMQGMHGMRRLPDART